MTGGMNSGVGPEAGNWAAIGAAFGFVTGCVARSRSSLRDAIGGIVLWIGFCTGAGAFYGVLIAALR
jgi:hypothetical protein